MIVTELFLKEKKVNYWVSVLERFKYSFIPLCVEDQLYLLNCPFPSLSFLFPSSDLSMFHLVDQLACFFFYLSLHFYYCLFNSTQEGHHPIIVFCFQPSLFQRQDFLCFSGGTVLCCGILPFPFFTG